MSNFSRDEFIRLIVDLMPVGSIIFGGYVRDKFIGESPRDIDVAMSENMKLDFIKLLRKKGIDVDVCYYWDNYANLKPGLIKEKYVLSLEDDSIELDIVFTDCMAYKEPINLETLDADVNSLYIEKMDSLRWSEIKTASPSFSCGEILTNIVNREYVPVNQESLDKPKGSGTRKTCLELKGYTVKNAYLDLFNKEIANRLTSDPNFSKENVAETRCPDLLKLYDEACTILNTKAESNNVSEKKEDITMSKSTLDRIQSAGEMGAKLALANTTTKLAKQGIISLLENKGGDNATVLMVAGFLDTEIGTAIVHAMIGLACQHAPIDQVKDNPKVQEMADLFLVKSAEVGMTQALDIMMTAFAPALQTLINGTQPVRVEIPSLAPKTRVNVNDMSDDEALLLMQELENKRNRKSA